ncbi:capsular exopolysaccharide synthesis family protein [Winogradskyella pacifica]|uniref:non-specific protein-tyrosine kinase n=1 Tax=Winogradskyella pacifica TaxID=664642 RepID=A0A3D9N6E2_9FLAO|nr:polysaccharide biosynthesis tyrosine autokinase [Winogradskyella pacifica]REE25783.1 capsular exopolysaccharide synthesis family protein [Winogradskyella pacifica]
MESKNVISTKEIKKVLDLYLSRWKLISFFVIIALALAYSYLRYSTNQYEASATIRIKDDKESQKLPSLSELSGGSLLSGKSTAIADEVAVMTSRTLLSNIVKNLNLNITYYKQGKIKEQEIYENPPIKLNFFAHDSIIHKIDTTLFIKIKSPSEFLMFKDDGKSLMNRDDALGKHFSFGDRIKTGFGDIVIVPNSGKYSPTTGSNLRVSIKRISSIIGQYKSNLIISTGAESSIVKLGLQDNIPKRAIDVLNQIIKEYNNDVIIDKEEVVKVTSDFINNRLELVFKELEEVDFSAEQLQKRNNLTALGSQADIYLQSERQNESQINSTTNNIQLIDYMQEELKEKSSSSDLLPSNIGLSDGGINQVTKTHNELVAERDKLLKNSTESNPVVINLNNQINTLKEQLGSSLENMRKSSEITLNNLNREDARIRGQLYSAPTKQRQLRDIERQQSIKESLYLYLLEKREESAIRLGMFTPNAKVIDNAYSSYTPVSPNKMFTYLAAFILGLVFPIAFIYLKDLLDTKIYDKDDLLEVLSIPYIGDVPLTSKKTKLISKVDYSPKAEAFRIIRSNIDFLLKKNSSKSKKIFITSTRAQEGKSHTSTNLATSISFSERTVLLIEMDIRVPKIMQYLKEKPSTEIGLSDYIADKSIKLNAIINKLKNNEYLDVISSGTIPPNPSELLMSDRVKDLFEYFEDKYDYIIVDTSAVGLVSDTLLVSKFADMFIYVVSANNVDKRQLAAVAKPLYNDKRLPNMNILLNGTDFGKKGYGYGYGYGNNPHKKKKWYYFSKK